MGNSEKSRRQDRPVLFIEEETVNVSEHSLRIKGWAADCSGKDPVVICFYDAKHQPLNAMIRRYDRADVREAFPDFQGTGEAGFYSELEDLKGTSVFMEIVGQGGVRISHRIPLTPSGIRIVKAGRLVKKLIRTVQQNGIAGTAVKVVKKIRNRRMIPLPYHKWRLHYLPSEEELQRQREETLPYSPLISIVVPLYRTPETWLSQLIQSVLDQTYSNWQLCLSDGSGKDSPLSELLRQYEEKDPRITVIRNEKPLHISENTNAAIAAAEGEFLAFADHDDLLTPDALYEIVAAVNQDPDAEMLYSDEDKISAGGSEYLEPQFKPDFNRDLLHTVNYICHLLVVRRTLLEETGYLRPEYDGAQDYDLILRCAEKAGHIVHIPKVLYHWRATEGSTSANPESKHYAFEAGRRALDAHFERIHVPAEVCEGEYPGLYRTRYLWKEKPLVSIIIPNKDHVEDLERCITSIEERSTYRNFEYVIVENNSTEERTFPYYEDLKRRNSRVKVVFYKGGFNYSAINNYGASFAAGEYYILLNNDTEIISENWIEEMLGYCMRPDVGIVGARLYYEDDTVQHAGVVIGFGEVAGHCFVMQPRKNTGYCHRIISAQNYSAVTAACMMVKKAAFDQVQGLSEDLAVAFNDVDFCLKVRSAGYLVVYNPYVELYHYESKSRGLEDTPEKQARFAKEIETIHAHWPGTFEKPDPYYNPNLTLVSQDFCLKRIWEE